MIDLVIWGNEHECQPNLSESAVGTYRILQPGSSIACSLSIGESSSHPKHMVFFEIKERKFRSRPIKYKMIRPFIYEDVTLSTVPQLSPQDAKVEEKIQEYLRSKVSELIEQARAEIEAPPSQDIRFSLVDVQKRSEERRVGKECTPQCRSRWSPYH
jgi:double-strand break repair protein MRE11